jgi:uncharacterized protein (DUF952 family)
MLSSSMVDKYEHSAGIIHFLHLYGTLNIEVGLSQMLVCNCQNMHECFVIEIAMYK